MLCYRQICDTCLNSESEPFTLGEISIIHRELSSLVDDDFKRLNINFKFSEDVDYVSVDNLRDAVYSRKTVWFPLMKHDFIDEVVYSRYRAWHDVIHHHFGGLSFDWEGEQLAWLLADHRLRTRRASLLTRQFVRHDILHINAMYHYFEGSAPKELTSKTIRYCFEE